MGSNKLRVAFVLDELFIPDVYGGGVLDIEEFALGCPGYGWDVSVHCLRSTVLDGTSGLLRRVAARAPLPLGPTYRDDSLGYEVHRIPAMSLGRQRNLPGTDADVVVLQGARLPVLALRYAALGARVVLRLVTAESVAEVADSARPGSELAAAIDAGRIRLAANSAFVAGLVHEAFGVMPEWEYPPTSPITGLSGLSGEGHAVLFVNPSPVKGLDTALAVAELLPHRRFIFQESWALGEAGRRALLERLRHLPNVELRPTRASLASVYADTSLLLVPSQWQEAFGRVVIEAQRVGIPAVASRIGGLPEAVGNGGVLVDRDASGREWADVVEAILTDYPRWQAQAFANGNHPKYSIQESLRSFVGMLDRITEPAAARLPG